MELKKIQEILLSDTVINKIVNTKKWSYHGTDIISLFEDIDNVYAYSNSKERYKVVRKYIEIKCVSIFNNLKAEQKDFFYRSLYLCSEINLNNLLGPYWSSNENTSPCISKEYGKEYLLKIDFNENIIDWKETLLSRIDYIHGDREMEYHLKSDLCKENVSNLEINLL